MKVLLVDDDKIIRCGLKKIIERAGEQFVIIGEANNGVTAFEIIKREEPDIVITDIKMPVMDGIELIEKVKENKFKCKIVALSGFDEYKFVRESLKNGAVDYLLKPIDNKDLIELMNKIKMDKEEEEKHIREYADKMEKSNKIINEKMLYKLLSNELYNNMNNEGKIKNFNLLEFKMLVISFRILNKEDIIYKLDEIRNKVFEHFDNVLDDLIICEYEKNLIVLHKKSEDEKMNRLLQLIRSEDKDIVYKSMDIDSNDIRGIYLQCTQGLLENFYGKKIQYSNQYLHDNQKNIDQLMEKIINDMELLNKADLRRNFEEFVKILKENSIYPKATKILIIKLIDLCKLKIDDFNNVYNESQSKEQLKVKDYIGYMKNFEDGRIFLLKFFNEMLENMKDIREGRSDRVIEFAKEYIKANYNRNISLKDVADKVYLNPNYLSELFKKNVGKNFIEYLIELRINKSKELLKIPGIKIYEVSNEVGYKDQVSFNRAFKRIVGMPPREYMMLVK
ncbi:response regulator [Clostridium saccharobutylicum]|uniref:Stage 0 sporulation protein A homolog n=1 Tax=Clostridium saccharobutylicum TaxID=169679 RepID=A0A1S8NBM4_CLOSA|nr:response regulator [Clostridium saccharobutylicum]OOM13768.1 putative response regulatory protein [Clostridium saccharobutylicum]